MSLQSSFRPLSIPTGALLQADCGHDGNGVPDFGPRYYRAHVEHIGALSNPAFAVHLQASHTRRCSATDQSRIKRDHRKVRTELID